MRKVLIVINGFALADGIKHQVKRLLEEFEKRDFVVDVKKNTEILAYLDHGNSVISIGKYDFVMYLDKDRYAAQLLEKAGYKLFNSIPSIIKCDDKMLTHICLADQGIKMPTSISSTLCYHDDGNRDYLKKISDILGFPLIVKENYGSLGKQVYLANDMTELEKIENKLIHIPHIFQEYISSSKGKDFRVIVIGGKAVAWMKRENKNSYLSNLAQGGNAYKVDLPKNYIELAERAAKILTLDYCGVDLLEGPDGEPLISEVNSNAFYEGIEKTTGVNVAAAYIDYIIKKIY